MAQRLPVALDRLADQLREVEPLAVELDLAAGHARGFQEVVDQERLVQDLALGRVDRPPPGFVPLALEAQDLDGIADRAQGVAELVREHREKVFLGAVRPLERGALLREPQGEVFQLLLADARPPELADHPVDPLFGRAVAGGDVRGLVEGVGAELLAEDGQRMRVQHVLEHRGRRAGAGIAAERRGAAAGQEAVQLRLIPDQPLAVQAPLQQPGQVPGGAQAGETVFERLLLGLAQEVQHRARIQAPPDRPLLALREDHERTPVELRTQVHPRRFQRALDPAPARFPAQIETTLTNRQTRLQKRHQRRHHLGDAVVDQAEVVASTEPGDPSLEIAHEKTSGRSGRHSGPEVFRVDVVFAFRMARSASFDASGFTKLPKRGPRDVASR